MRLSTIYSALLSALAIGATAGPVPISAVTSVIETEHPYKFHPRALPANTLAGKRPAGKAAAAKTPVTVEPEKTDRYKEAVAAAAKHQKTLVPGVSYVFTIEWDLPAAVEGTTESKTELQQLQQKLQFEHVAVVAGTIVENTSGLGKNKKTKLDFDAYFMDLMKDEDKISSILRGPKRLEPMKKGQTLVWSKQTTDKKGALSNMTKVGKAYFNDPAHNKYSVENNNCATFRDSVLPQL